MKGVVGSIAVALVLLIALPAMAFAAPDVTVTSLAVSPSTAKISQPANVTATIQNIGDATATGANVTFNITRGSSIITAQLFTGYALDPNEVQTISFSWTPFAAGTHTITADVKANSDPNKLNDISALNVNVASTGTVQITNFFASPALLVDSSGCASVQPLYISGYAKEDGTGTNDGVLIYVNSELYTFARANAGANGFFEANLNGVCFDTPGPYTVTANIDRGAGTIATASANINVIFSEINGSSGSLPNLVDVSASPRILAVGAGKYAEFTIAIENIGTLTDTYTIKANPAAGISSWLDLEKNSIIVSPGQTVYVSLFVSVPSTAEQNSYPINIIVQGRSTDIERIYLVVDSSNSGYSGSGTYYASQDYAVDVSAAPSALSIDSGESSEYIVTVQNIGKKPDTYSLNVIANSKIKSWFTFKQSRITLSPGQKQDVVLYVDAPDTATTKSYPVGIEANGNAIDIERVALSVARQYSSYDVTIGKPRLSQNTISNYDIHDITVNSDISFVDASGESTGEYVLAKLYVNRNLIQTKNVFVPSGEVKSVSFALSAENPPINSEAGTYEIYVTGAVGDEIDRSPAATLTVIKAGTVEITGITPTAFNTSANKEIAVSLTLKNDDLKDNTYTISADSAGSLAGKVGVDPLTITVPKGKTVTSTVKIKIGNADDGKYDIVLKATSAEGNVDSKILSTEVKGGQIIVPPEKPPDTGTSPGTAQLLFGVGGTFAAIIGAIILALIFAYYYHTTNEIEIFGKKIKQADDGSSAKAIAESLKKEAAAQKGKIMVWEGVDFERAKAKSEKTAGDWTPQKADNVLINLESIRDEFTGTLNEAGKIKKRLTGITGETSEMLKGKISQIKSAAGNVERKTGNGFVDRVIESI